MRDSRRARENRQKIGIPQVHKSTTKDIYSLFFFKSSENRSTSWPFLGQELFAFLHYCLRVDVLIQLKLPPSCFGLGQGSFKMSTRKLFMRACLLTFFPNDSQNMTSNAVCTNAVQAQQPPNYQDIVCSQRMAHVPCLNSTETRKYFPLTILVATISTRNLALESGAALT